MVSEDLVKSLIGKTETNAVEEATASKVEVQVVRRDEEVFMSDMMMNMDRVKLEIEKGLVVLATIG